VPTTERRQPRTPSAATALVPRPFCLILFFFLFAPPPRPLAHDRTHYTASTFLRCRRTARTRLRRMPALTAALPASTHPSNCSPLLPTLCRRRRAEQGRANQLRSTSTDATGRQQTSDNHWRRPSTPPLPTSASPHLVHNPIEAPGTIDGSGGGGARDTGGCVMLVHGGKELGLSLSLQQTRPALRQVGVNGGQRSCAFSFR
jgi:hypothetical protein